jgi:hypothetical protein
VSDLKFDGTDVVFDAFGNASLVEYQLAVAQRLYLRLVAQRGEWFLNIKFGIDWRAKVLVRKPNLVEISALIRAEIMNTPDVVRLVSFDFDFDRTTGRITLTFEVTTPFGNIAASSEAEDIGSLILLLMLTPVGSIT